MRVRPYTSDDDERWERLAGDAPMTTFQHTRRFLSYHGDRFEDASVLVEDERGGLLALLPAAIDPDDAGRVVSHPGATFGGLVHDGSLTGERALEALAAIAAHHASAGRRSLRYKAVPHIYHRSPSGDDVWALAELGAVRVACELSCAIDLAARREPSARRARSLRKAAGAGVELSESAGLDAFWPVLESTLASRHAVRPVHTLAEIELLRSRFPDRIRLVAALLDGRVAAGTVLFESPAAVHTQYLASGEDGRAVGALDAALEHAIEAAGRTGARYFDFGISPGPDRRGLNPGLYRFKAEFGGGGVVHEVYELALEGGP